MSNALAVTDETFQSEVLDSDMPVVVDYWAEWCGPCRMASPVLDKIAEEYAGKVKVCKVNVDDARQTATQNGIMSIPTLHIFKGGQAVDQMVGVSPNFEDDLKKKIDAQL